MEKEEKIIAATGALLDSRIEEDKQKDWLHEEIASGVESFTWEERPMKDSYYFPYNQYMSLSCVAGGIAITEEHFAKNRNVSYVPSRKDVYIRRFNYPQGGMMMHDAFNIGIKGMASENLVPSQGLSETPMNTQYPVTSDIIKERSANLFSAWVSIAQFRNIDTIAKIAASVPVVCFWFFDEDFQYQEWWKQRPEIINQNLTLNSLKSAHHQVAIVDAILIGGKKFLIGQDTAGIGTGAGKDKNIRIISEEMVTRRLYSAGYGIDAPAIVVPPKPKFAFTRPLSFGMSGEDVKALQEVLKYEKLIVLDASTGYFGGITLKGVKNLQAKYADKILKPAGLKAPTGYVGTNTLKWLKENYGV